MVRGDRGQAYTLEGFVGAIVLLTAVLLIVQSVVVAPTAGGDVDRSVRAQLQAETKDALVVADAEGELSHLIRYWDPEGGGYYNRNVDENASGQYTGDRFANRSAMNGTAAEHHPFGFGELLEERFTQGARSYNVELVYQNRSGDGVETESFYLVYQGSPDSGGVSASHTVTLVDDQELTAPGTTETLREAENRSDTGGRPYPIPNVAEDERLYNVVEVRLVVW